MTEPVDPNEPAAFPPYAPPPGGFAPPPGYGPSGYQPPAGYGPSPGYLPPGAVTWTAWNPTPTPPPPSHTKRNVLIAVAVVVVLAAAGVIAFATLSGNDKSSSKSHPKTPAAFGGYELLDNAAADQVKSSMRQMGQTMSGGAAAKLFAAASIGVYSHDSGDLPVLITLTMPTSAAGTTMTSDEITTRMLAGATTSNDPFPSGSHGGSTRCGLAQFGAVSETMCAWSDDTDSGLLVSVRESLSPSDLATLTQKFRDAVE